MKRIICILSCIIFLILFSTVVCAKDSVYNENKTVSFSGGKRVVNAVYVNLNDNKIRLEAEIAKNKIGATDDLKNIASQAKDSNTEVVAAINGSYFNAYTDMVPWGTLISKGEYQRLGSSGSVIGISTDNKVTVDRLKVSITGGINGNFTYPNNWYAWTINNINPDPAAIDILNSYYGQTTGKTSKTCIIVDNRRVTGIKKGESQIPQNGYIIVTQDQSIIKRFKVGDTVDYKLETSDIDTKSSLDWSNIRTAVGAGPTLLKAGKIYANAEKEGFKEDKITKLRWQRSFAGVTKDNIMILATVPNATMKELAEIAKNMGCIDAINLDSGASSCLYYNGKYITSPGRKICNALVVTRLKEAPARLQINGKEFIPGNDMIIDSATKELLVPVKDICNKISAAYSTNNNKITINRYSKTISMTIGSNSAEIDGIKTLMKSKPISKQNTVYVPIEIISKALGGTLGYNKEKNIYTASFDMSSISDLLLASDKEKDKGNYNKAIELAQKALSLDSKDKTSHYKLAMLYGSIMDNESKIEHLVEFLKYEPNNTDALMSLGWCYYSIGKIPEALGIFEKASNVDSQNATAWYGQGLCHQAFVLKEYKEAINCYQIALKCKSVSKELAANINKQLEACKAKLSK